MGLTKYLTRAKHGDVELDFSPYLRQFAVKPIPLDTDTITTGKLKSRKQEWQERSRELFYGFGPWGALLDWRAAAFSRIKFYIAKEPDSFDGDTAPPPVTDPKITKPLDMLSDGDPNRATENWYRYRILMDLLGECYLAGYSTEYDDPDSAVWGFYSPFEVTEEAREIYLPDGNPRLRDDGTPVVSYVRVQTDEDEYQSLPAGYSSIQRIWRKDPFKSWLAFSAARYAQPILEVLEGQLARASAETKSRLWTSGILCLGEDGYLPPPPAHARSLHEDPQIAALMYQWSLTMKDRSGPEAIIPQVANAKASDVGLVSLASEFSKQLPENATLFMDWLAMSVPTPPEMLKGNADAKYWSAWLSNEDAVEIYLKPDAAALAANLYQGIVKPWHEANGITGYMVAYDTAPLTEERHQGEMAIRLREMGDLSRDVVLSKNGFTPDDAPDDDGDTTLLRELAIKGVDPAIVEPYLKALGINVDAPDRTTVNATAGSSSGGRTAKIAPDTDTDTDTGDVPAVTPEVTTPIPRSDPRALDPGRPRGPATRAPSPNGRSRVSP